MHTSLRRYKQVQKLLQSVIMGRCELTLPESPGISHKDVLAVNICLRAFAHSLEEKKKEKERKKERKKPLAAVVDVGLKGSVCGSKQTTHFKSLNHFTEL